MTGSRPLQTEVPASIAPDALAGPASDDGRRVARRPSSGPMRKANETLVPIPLNRPVTSQQQSLWNALARLAQMQGIDKPIHRASLADIRRAFGGESITKDDRLLVAAIESLTDVAVTWHIVGSEPEQLDLEDGGQSVSVEIDRTKVITGKSRWLAEVETERNARGQTFVKWTYGALLKARFLSPTSLYTMLSLEEQCRLGSIAAKRLYEVASQFKTNPGGLTSRLPWQRWRPILTGHPEPAGGVDWGIYEEFKNFRRKVVDQAVAEIRMRTALRVEPIFWRSGRCVTDLQFRIWTQSVPGADDGPVDMALLARVMALGVHQTRAVELLRAHAPRDIERAIQLTESKGPAIRSRAAWFVRALEGRWAEEAAAPARPRATVDPARRIATAREQAFAGLRARRVAEALALHAESDRQSQADALHAYLEHVAATNPVLTATARRLQLRSKVVREDFGAWLAHRHWGAPTEADLTTFLLEQVAAAGE